ncbi:hypothetical protein [Streptomyces pseudovenezuelae]|uniref:hypothetical protein n=1 Tax=Streptomyces pseudovenezuelae TaxID=67350 RepID=UPI0036E0CD74
MRVRLTDGTHEIEIETDDGPKSKGHRRRLDDVENAALRILDALRDERPTRRGVTFGFTPDAALDSTVERAEPYDDGRGDQYEDEGEDDRA